MQVLDPLRLLRRPARRHLLLHRAVHLLAQPLHLVRLRVTAKARARVGVRVRVRVRVKVRVRARVRVRVRLRVRVTVRVWGRSRGGAAPASRRG